MKSSPGCLRREQVGALSVSVGWRGDDTARTDVSIMTSVGGCRVRAPSRHLLTRVARMLVREANRLGD
jgi:hypothetical protein